eukprot:Pompholyxophrys_punicea_v1_NODE_205_length_2758_cov_6.359230.p1 type:complete len:123 gc:universal NODE_205_length_2758_cov_6.359230:1586-1218(-)
MNPDVVGPPPNHSNLCTYHKKNGTSLLVSFMVLTTSTTGEDLRDRRFMATIRCQQSLGPAKNEILKATEEKARNKRKFWKRRRKSRSDRRKESSTRLADNREAAAATTAAAKRVGQDDELRL